MAGGWCGGMAETEACMAIELRPGRDEDADGLIELIGGCWSEYSGCLMDVDGENPHLRAIATAYAGWGGRVWIAEDAGQVVGSVGIVPAGDPAVGELRMLYVAKPARKAGLGTRLLRLAEAEATRRGMTTMRLWTDTRFADAHRFYERHGYERGPDTRELHDLSDSVEYFFRKGLPPSP
jgi:putative acetyltransferase